MNSIPYALNRLEHLIGLAHRADTDFEKAAVFAASAPLIAFIKADAEKRFPHALENVERLRWSLAASVEYEIDNGHDVRQHRAWARAAVAGLRDTLIE